MFFCVSGVAPDDQQPLEGSEGGNLEQNSPNASSAPQVSLLAYLWVNFVDIKRTSSLQELLRYNM